jgi:hypothetical protein
MTGKGVRLVVAESISSPNLVKRRWGWRSRRSYSGSHIFLPHKHVAYSLRSCSRIETPDSPAKNAFDEVHTGAARASLYPQSLQRKQSGGGCFFLSFCHYVPLELFEVADGNAMRHHGVVVLLQDAAMPEVAVQMMRNAE